MSKETGGQAFPRQQWEYDGQNNVLSYQEEGATLLDYFAAKAMQGIMGNSSMIDDASNSSLDWAATKSYAMADAMLKARAANKVEE